MTHFFGFNPLNFPFSQMGLLKKYKRWRHSKGYGVHSPYAYKLVTDVLRPGIYGYYSYHEIEHWAEETTRHFKWERRILFTIRLIEFLKAKRLVCLEKTLPEEIAAKALHLPYSVIKKKEDVFKNGDLLIIDSFSSTNPLPMNKIREAIKTGIPVFAVRPNDELSQLLSLPIKKGLLLKDKHRVILIPREEMDYIAYDISLKFR